MAHLMRSEHFDILTRDPRFCEVVNVQFAFLRVQAKRFKEYLYANWTADDVAEAQLPEALADVFLATQMTEELRPIKDAAGRYLRDEDFRLVAVALAYAVFDKETSPFVERDGGVSCE